MYRERIFPFQLVEKGANIALYGAGALGKRYWEQVKAVDWCNIIEVFDKNCFNIKDFYTKVKSLECITERTYYDYIVIAIVSEAARAEAVHELLKKGIAEERIISSVDQYITYENQDRAQYELKGATCEKEQVSIAFCPWGTLGDYVVLLRIYQELIKYIEHTVIDIFTSHVAFAQCVFGNQPYLGEIYGEGWKWREYHDVVLGVGDRVYLQFLNKKRVERLEPELAEKMLFLQKSNQEEFSNYPVHSFPTTRLILERARFLGRNRYTIFQCERALEITDTNVKLAVAQSAEQEYLTFGFKKKYITFNYGANQCAEGKVPQTKMWPKEYHVQLNRLMKEKYPDIEVVQLGAENSEKLAGADRYIMGANLEVVKVILRESLCHIDCEGGLVHIATQLGTRCVVLFGPTPSWFYGYEQNINIVAEICKECLRLYPDWQTKCHKYDRPECMYSITPEKVYERLVEHIDSVKKTLL